MWMRVCVGRRGRVGEDEEKGTSEERKHAWKTLLCLGWRAMNITVLKWVKMRGFFKFRHKPDDILGNSTQAPNPAGGWSGGEWSRIRSLAQFCHQLGDWQLFEGTPSARKEGCLSDFLCLVIKHTHMWKNINPNFLPDISPLKSWAGGQKERMGTLEDHP